MFHSLIWGYCADTAFRVGDATLCVMDLLSFGVSVLLHSVLWICSHLGSVYCYTLCYGPAVILGQCTVTLCVMDLLSFGVSVLLHSVLWTCCHSGSVYCYTLCYLPAVIRGQCTVTLYVGRAVIVSK